MNAPDWLAAYAEKLDVPAPTADELKAVLDLAGVAAHSSQRIAARPGPSWGGDDRVPRKPLPGEPHPVFREK